MQFTNFNTWRLCSLVASSGIATPGPTWAHTGPGPGEILSALVNQLTWTATALLYIAKPHVTCNVKEESIFSPALLYCKHCKIGTNKCCVRPCSKGKWPTGPYYMYAGLLTRCACSILVTVISPLYFRKILQHVKSKHFSAARRGLHSEYYDHVRLLATWLVSFPRN